MSDTLPANKALGKRDVFDMLVLRGLENVTKSLRMGDAHELNTLRPLAQRCRALADAFEARMSELNETDNGNTK